MKVNTFSGDLVFELHIFPCCPSMTFDGIGLRGPCASPYIVVENDYKLGIGNKETKKNWIVNFFMI